MNFNAVAQEIQNLLRDKKILKPMIRDAVQHEGTLKIVWGPLARGQKNTPTYTETIDCGTKEVAREAAHYVKGGCADLGVVVQGPGKAVEAPIPPAFQVAF